jgi:hypothetical protein
VSGLRGNTPEFAYNLACLQSQLGNTDAAFDWFSKAIAFGYSQIVRAKQDPDLEQMRHEHAADFADLVTVKYQWGVDTGIFHGDVVLTNTSKFPLTDIVLDATLDQNGNSWTQTLCGLAILRCGTERETQGFK